MNTLLRILGVQLVAAAAARLPGGLARLATAVVLVVVNLLPVWAVTEERIGMGDVFLVYWIENVVVWACGIVRTATAQGPGKGTVPVTTNGVRGDLSSARFFALHYGIFTGVHGVFTVIVVALVGLTGGVGQVVLLSLAITASHLFSLGVNWFGRDERMVVSPGTAMFAPYPRMFVLHVGILIGFGVALDGWEHGENVNDQVSAVAVLCVLKTLVDLGFHVWQHRSRQVARRGDGLYGAPAAQE
ncbi:DUF6498-containing protein [Nocardioides sp.]|uniref:DUF6498-containing protein n=1 Tax=Nocardioides sp. TaxID=35761 RepID=UPI001A2F5906|nr:DUF6498-containing protein [Nocardioides sp.]MBJ7357321.1 hypothetical protein [Nocardioides sp.]